MRRIVISSGHGKYVRGAEGYIDEVNEARRVVNRVAEIITQVRGKVVVFHDDVSRSQSENLDRIVDFHNSNVRDLDVSVHFNATDAPTDKPIGTECLYLTQEELAEEVSLSISVSSGLIDRGAKYRDGLAFLNGTEMPAILIEVCFVDSRTDVDLYEGSFNLICEGIAAVIVGEEVGPPIPPEPPQPEPEGEFYARGTCSWFGGPADTGVSESEGLAFLYEYEDAPHLFLIEQPPGTSGLARRLNPKLFYIACRWDYGVTSKSYLANPSRQALVKANGRELLAWPADWGPNENTGRVADLSPGLMEALGVDTDDEVEVVYPAP